MKKKIVFFMPSMEGGGVEKNLILISNFLSKKFNVNIITFDKKFNKYFDSSVKKINFVNKPLKINKYFKYFFCLLLLIKELIFSRSLVFSFQANIYCLIVCKFLFSPVIIRSNSSPSGWTKNYLKNLIFKIFLKKSNEIVVNSNSFKKEIDKKFNTNAKLILNPLNKNYINFKANEKNNFSFFRKGDLKIINVARFTDQKDHLTLLKAFRIISKKIKSKLLLIGYGINQKKIENFIKKNNLKKLVKISNYTDNPFLFIKRSDIFILSSKYEGLPNVLLEAMVLKKFIISSNCPTGPEEILNKENYGLLFKVGDYEELAEKIMYYHKNKKKLKQKIKNGYKSLNRFDFLKNCKKYENLINKHQI